MNTLKSLLEQFSELSTYSPLTIGLMKAGVATVILLLLLLIVRFIVSRSRKTLAGMSVVTKGIKYRNWEILRAESAQKTLGKGISFIHSAIKLILVIIYAITVLSFFTQTSNVADNFLVMVWQNIRDVAISVALYMPKLVFIIIAGYITLQAIKLFRAFMAQVESKRIQFKMFPAEYAVPTRQILTFAIVVFSLVVIAPYLPGAGTQAFQGVTLFLGVLVSLGSTTAIANIVASFVIQYMQAFKVGDTVKIAAQTGTVMSINLFSTRMETLTREYVSIPNGIVLTSSMINYSRNNCVAVEVGISIGYDVPWRTVHEALLEAAGKVEEIITEPEPFIIQKSLDDYYVSYRLYTFTRKAKTKPFVVSRLNESIRDVFEGRNIEILSPAHNEIHSHLPNLDIDSDTIGKTVKDSDG